MATNNLDRIYTISKSPADVKFINYLYKFSFIGVFIVSMIIIFDESISNDFNNWMIVIAFGLLIFFFVKFHRRFAHKIIINRDEEQVEFHMLRNDNIVITSLDAIEKVYVNLYITFFFDGRKVMYNDARNEEFTEILNNLMKVKWGFWGRLLPRLGIRH
jgi:hypothetical protein